MTTLMNREFVISALPHRLDLRSPSEYRKIKLSISDKTNVQALLGNTRIFVFVNCEIVKPLAAAPRDGIITFNSEFSKSVSPSLGGAGGGGSSAVSEEELLLSRLLEKAFKKSRAVDTEGLCIIAGEKACIPAFQKCFGDANIREKVWNIRVDIKVLDHDGNLTDCACIATVAALLNFKRPDVTISDQLVTVHTIDEKPYIPLSVHHLPICTTLSIFNNGETILLDPTLLEESAQQSQITFILNTHRELLSVLKSGGSAVSTETVLKCLQIAQLKVADVAELVRNFVKSAEKI
ncbi:Exosome complex component RRP45 [Nowakowskiella sp. JEL0407]|nr:Exosome complex component RRP45 [Nowakowskiella sp. JEL0407]